MDRKLEKWLRWLKIIEEDVQRLLVNRNIFWELQEIVKANANLRKPSSFYGYLGDTFIAYISMGIRRQIKNDENSISFVRLLDDISKNPSSLTRTYFKSLYTGFVVAHWADRDFNKYAGTGAHISPSLVLSDLLQLKDVARKVEKWADKRIAHRDRSHPKNVPTFREVDSCLDTLNKLYCKYHLLFHAKAMQSLMPVYQYDWKEIFTVPWIPKD